MKYQLLGDDVHFSKITTRGNDRDFYLQFCSTIRYGELPLRTYSIDKKLMCIGDTRTWTTLYVQLHPLEIPGIKITKYLKGEVRVEVLSKLGDKLSYKLEGGRWVF